MGMAFADVRDLPAAYFCNCSNPDSLDRDEITTEEARYMKLNTKYLDLDRLRGLLLLLSVLSSCSMVTNSPRRLAANSMDVNTSSTYTDNSTSERDAPLNSVKIARAEAAQAGDITIQILNVSKKPVKLWEDSNSWGATCWRVLVLRDGHLETFYQYAGRIFTVNRPTFNEIAAGASLEQKLHLNGGNWCGLGHCALHFEHGFGGRNATFEPGDTVIVIYDVPPTEEAREKGVWNGVIAATTGVAVNQSLKAGGINATRSNGKINKTERPKLPVEKSMNAIKINSVEVSRVALINVELQNISPERVKVWNGANSWGATCWRVLRIRNGRLDTFFQNPDQGFTKNGPTFNEIAAGARLEQKFDLNGGNWCGLDHCSIYNERGFGGQNVTFEKNDRVIVVYDVPATQEARDNGVWYGVIAATVTVQ